jgi:DNA-binding NarL/FixJ family response regulator
LTIPPALDYTNFEAKSVPRSPGTEGSSNKIPENQNIEPKTEFGKQCYQLLKSGKSDEEIAETLHKPLQNIRMTLRNIDTAHSV